jgi:hypothetical protein
VFLICFSRKKITLQHGNTRIFLNIKIKIKFSKREHQPYDFTIDSKKVVEPSIGSIYNFTSHNDLVAPLGTHY